MGIPATTSASPGLRERKKQTTRANIERAAMELFAERGYDETTLAEIADAADIAPRTPFAYFESKEDILFCDEPMFHQRLEHALTQRPPWATTGDALRDFLSSPDASDAQARLRRRIIAASEGLRASERARPRRKSRGHPPAARCRICDRCLYPRPQPPPRRIRRPALPRADAGDPHQILTFLRRGLEALQRAKPG